MGRQSRPNGASRAIWAPGHAYSASRGGSRRTTLWLVPPTPRSPWSATRWRIEPFPSTLPFRSLTDYVLTDKRRFKRSFEIQTLVCDQRMTGGGWAERENHCEAAAEGRRLAA